MNKFNIGDLVEIMENRCGHHFNIGDIVEVISFDDRTGTYKVSNGDDEWSVVIHEIKPINQYEQSNRYKLSQFIKAQPFKAIELSVAIGHQATYLSSTASKSRFESRGDISDTQLREIMTDVTTEVSKLNNPNQEKINAMNDLKVESEFKKLADGCRNMGNAANQAGLSISKFNQQVKTKSIQASKKTVWFTVFLITVLIVSLLATLIYLA